MFRRFTWIFHHQYILMTYCKVDVQTVHNPYINKSIWFFIYLNKRKIPTRYCKIFITDSVHIAKARYALFSNNKLYLCFYGAFNARSRACKTETLCFSALLDDDDDNDRYHVHRKHAFKPIECKGEWESEERTKERRQREREHGKRWVGSHGGQWFIFVLPRTSREGGSLIR